MDNVFGNFMKKVEELAATQNASNLVQGLTSSPNSNANGGHSPARKSLDEKQSGEHESRPSRERQSSEISDVGSVDDSSSETSVESLKTMLKRYKEKLHNGMKEYKKVLVENDKLREEVKDLSSKQSRPGETPEDFAALKAKNEATEKELSQIRIKAKLKITQLQKELDAVKAGSSKSSTASSDNAPSADSQNENEHSLLNERISDLEKQLQESRTQTRDTTTRLLEVESALNSLTMAHEDIKDRLLSYEEEFCILQKDTQSQTVIQRLSGLVDTVRQTSQEASTQSDKIADSNEVKPDTDESAEKESESEETKKLKMQVSDLMKKVVSLQLELEAERESKEENINAEAVPSDSNVEVQSVRKTDGSTTAEDDSALPNKEKQEAAETLASTNDDDSTKRKLEELEERYNDVLLELSQFKSQAAQEKETAVAIVREELEGKLNSLQQELYDIRAKVTQPPAVPEQKEDPVAASQMAKKLEKLEQLTFSQEEQIKDLKIQVANRQIEVTNISESLATKNSEYDALKTTAEEKLKKMKGLLLAANKNMTETKKLLAAKEAEVESIKEDIASVKEKNEELLENNQELEQKLAQAAYDTLDEKQAQAGEKAMLEAELESTKVALQSLQTEFSSYKARAHAALQKNSSSASEKRVQELEDSRRELERLNKNLDDEISILKQKAQKQHDEIELLLERLAGFEARAERWDAIERELESAKREVEHLQRRLELEKTSHKQGLEDKQAMVLQEIQAMKNLHTKELEILNRKVTELTETNTHLESDLSSLTTDWNKLKEEHGKVQADLERLHRGRRGSDAGAPNKRSLSISTSLFGANDTRPPTSLTSSPTNTHLPLSMMGTAELSSFKEKEYQLQIEQLTQLVNDNQAEIERLLEQEKIIKEELRRVDRIEGRQNLNTEYLKNVVMSFLESDVREPLVPIIANILQLSPEEVTRIRKAAGTYQEQPSLLTNFGLFG